MNDGAGKTTLGRERAFRDGAGRARLYPGAWKEIARLAYLFFSWWGTKERRIGESPAGLASGGRGRRRRGLRFDGLARQAGRREVHGAGTIRRWPFYLSRTETKMIRTIPTRWHGTAAQAVLENFMSYRIADRGVLFSVEIIGASFFAIISKKKTRTRYERSKEINGCKRKTRMVRSNRSR